MVDYISHCCANFECEACVNSELVEQNEKNLPMMVCHMFALAGLCSDYVC